MSKMRLIAKLALTVLGIYLLAQLLRTVPLVVYMGLQARGPVAIAGRILVVVSGSVGVLILVWYLLFSRRWAAMMVGSGNGDSETVGRIWVVAGFRTVLLFCGAMMIWGSVPFLLNAGASIIVGPRVLISMIIHRYVDPAFSKGWFEWMDLFIQAVRTVLGVYLILGAPHLLRWHVGEINGGLPCDKSDVDCIIERTDVEDSSDDRPS